MASDEDDKLCRYCFEGEEDGPLISPCHCKGDQKYVHLACLRRWQRSVLVSQPTHPAFYQRDPRHYECNVCKGTFTCQPPTRHELMSSFTGPELATYLESGCIIASHAVFTEELMRLTEGLPPALQERSSHRHWMGGVFLITEVAPLDRGLTVPISSATALATLRTRLGTSMSLTSNGQRLRLVAGAALEGVSERELPAALAALEYCEGLSLELQRDPPPGIGDDHVTAINLTRRIRPVDAEAAAAAQAAAARKYAGAKDVEVVHYVGGPCAEDEISCCVVPGGHNCGWAVVKELQAAIEMAHARAYKRCEGQGDVRGGQTVTVHSLQARPELNGEMGIALRFNEASGRWLVRLKNGDGKQLKPSNLTASGPQHGCVHCVWGDAQWSRTQLLGEIARGSWGLCRASVAELIAEPDSRWDALDGKCDTIVCMDACAATRARARTPGPLHTTAVERDRKSSVTHSHVRCHACLVWQGGSCLRLKRR